MQAGDYRYLNAHRRVVEHSRRRSVTVDTWRGANTRGRDLWMIVWLRVGRGRSALLAYRQTSSSSSKRGKPREQLNAADSSNRDHGNHRSV